MRSRRHIATLTQIVFNHNYQLAEKLTKDGKHDPAKSFSELAKLFAKENAEGFAYRYRVKAPSLKPYKNIEPKEAVKVDLYQALVVIRGFEAQVLERDDWEDTNAYMFINWAKQDIIAEIVESHNVDQKYYKL